MIYIILTYLLFPFLYFSLLTRNKKSIKKILIIQTAKIGDLICSTPIFREIKKKYPNVHLTVMANPVTKQLLEHNPHVDEIIVILNKDFRGFFGKIRLSNIIKKGRYDIAICLNPNVPFAIALVWGLVPVRVSIMPNFTGFTFKMASHLFTYLEPHFSGQHIITTYMKMLKAIGVENPDTTKEVYKSQDANEKVKQILDKSGRPLIGIAVSSGNKLKELGTAKIIRLITMLLNNIEAYIVLIGSEQDKDAANIIINASDKKDRIINATGKLSLKELPALIEKLSLFIGVDTGITYMADALSIPIVNIAGPADMEDQRPTGKNAVIIQKNDLPCVPCSHAFKSPYYCKINTRGCIESVSPEEIYHVAKKLLSEYN